MSPPRGRPATSDAVARTLATIAPLLLAAACGGCAGREATFDEARVAPVTSAATDLAGRVRAKREEAAAAWAGREDPARVKVAIAAWEAAAALDPLDGTSRADLSRAHYFFAEAFLREEGKRDELVALLEKGTAWGEQALAVQAPEFARRLASGERFEAAVTSVEGNAIAALYWYGVNLGRWARARGIAELLGNKDRVKSVMDRVLALDETFFHAAPHRYFGAYYSLLPSIAGRDTAKSKEHFEKALQLAPAFAGTKVLYADTYCVKMQDRALYERLLGEVVAASPDALPDVGPETRVEQQKARKLLAEVAELF